MPRHRAQKDTNEGVFLCSMSLHRTTTANTKRHCQITTTTPHSLERELEGLFGNHHLSVDTTTPPLPHSNTRQRVFFCPPLPSTVDATPAVQHMTPLSLECETEASMLPSSWNTHPLLQQRISMHLITFSWTLTPFGLCTWVCLLVVIHTGILLHTLNSTWGIAIKMIQRPWKLERLILNSKM